MSKEKKFNHFEGQNGVYRAVPSTEKISKLDRGFYEVIVDTRTNELYFKQTKNVHDKIIDLPDTAYNKVVGEINQFLTEKTKSLFEEFGFLYKRSSLLYGPPGTGKTCIINRVANTIIEKGGVVLFNPSPRYLSQALDRLNDIQPETIVMVVFEELDRLTAQYEDSLLSILDGEIQKENIIYLASTNFIEKVPNRIKRPGRNIHL